MKLKKLKLSEIKGTVYQPRSQPDLELENLIQSIINNGMITPITVRETGLPALPSGRGQAGKSV